MASVEGLCSAGTERDVQAVTLPGTSAVSVYFVVVPLITGNIPIQVSALTSDGMGDVIRKDLKVVVRNLPFFPNVFLSVRTPFVNGYVLLLLFNFTLGKKCGFAYRTITLSHLMRIDQIIPCFSLCFTGGRRPRI